jgi:competence protein ComEC
MKASVIVTAAVLIVGSSCRNREVTSVPPDRVRVAFLDVGQGDAALLRTPEGITIVFDAGHNEETARLLRAEGVSRIDLLVLSHAHADHSGGLASILRTFSVVSIWYAGPIHGRLQQLLASTGITESVNAGKAKTFGRLSLSVLHPEADSNDVFGRSGETAVNNRSVVVRAEYEGARYLFPGDCELGCWQDLFNLHRSELAADVLKAAHHGSWNGTNSGVLINVHPSTVVITCGRENRYGHPHEIVLRLIEKLGATLFRTDQQGTVRCVGAYCRAGT